MSAGALVPKISLAYLEPEETTFPLMLERWFPLDPAALTKVAPAVERPGIHLGVSGRGDDLRIWGVARTIPRYCCVVEVAEPGLLVVKHHRGDELAKYANVAVLQGDRIRLVDEKASGVPSREALSTTTTSEVREPTAAGTISRQRAIKSRQLNVTITMES